ncbi:hypothetical protein KGQ34_01955 [Patescibacteria group bacterium]|nr:hypothetical protein [Patescibacteria group bacterium]
MFVYVFFFTPHLMGHYWYVTVLPVAIGGFFSFYKIFFFFAVGFKKGCDFQYLIEKRSSLRYRCILYGFIFTFIGYWIIFFLWLMFGFNPAVHL